MVEKDPGYRDARNQFCRCISWICLNFNVLHLLKFLFVSTSVKEDIYYNFLKSTEAGTASCYPLINV